MNSLIELPAFKPWPKTPRFLSNVTATEKIDGTNAQVTVLENGAVIAGSRNRYLTEENDNYGFARWVRENRDSLRELGVGTHYGEWWGKGIQRGYGLGERRFSLFNTSRWNSLTPPPACCHVVPVLFEGPISQVWKAVDALETSSVAAPGFDHPEGVCLYHHRSGQVYKVPFDKQTADFRR